MGLLEKIRTKSPRDSGIEQPLDGHLGKRLRIAIDRISYVFEPSVLDHMAPFEQAQKAMLDRIEFNSIAAIQAWESGWLDLIGIIKQRMPALGLKVEQ